MPSIDPRYHRNSKFKQATSFSSLRFPADVGTNNVPAYVTFTPQQVKYGGTTGLNPINRPSVASSNIASPVGSINPFIELTNAVGGVIDSLAQSANDTINDINNTFNSFSLNTSFSNIGSLISGRLRIGSPTLNFGQRTEADKLFTKGTISLFLPPGLSTKSGVSYTAEEIGALGLAASNTVAESSQDKLDTGKAAGGLAVGSLQKLLNASGNLRAINAMSRGEVVNNFSFQIFNGVEHRGFTYSFKMVPKDEHESRAIKDICDMFLYFMLPSRVQKGNGDEALHFYEIPAQWKIEYKKQGASLDFFQQPRACFLQNIDVQYNTDDMDLYNDGAPMAVTLNLEFIEIEPLYRADEISSFNRRS